MATLEKLVLDAKRISTRLNDNLLVGDSLINEIEFINEQLKTLKTVSVLLINSISKSFARCLIIAEFRQRKLYDLIDNVLWLTFHFVMEWSDDVRVWHQQKFSH